MAKRASFRVTAVVIMLFFSVSAFAVQVVTVEADGTGDYPTIQAAIDDVNNGDIIEVQPGTYIGNGNRDIDFGGKAITVRSIDPNDPNIVTATIIDCQGSWSEPHRGFRFSNGETPESIIDGLMIVNGYAPTERVRRYSYPVGGAIFCDSSDPTIRNCVIKNNEVYLGTGTCGGIYCTKSNLTIINTVIENNIGGGLLCDYSNVVIDGCVINNNISGSNIVGVRFRKDCDAKITNTKITNHPGTGIGCYESELTLEGCLIQGNNGSFAGGMSADKSDVTFKDCVIADNSSISGGGGGMQASTSDVTFKNCVIAGNTSKYYGGGIEYRGNLQEDHTLTISNCVMLQSELDISRNFVNLYNFGRKCYENEPQEIFS